MSFAFISSQVVLAQTGGGLPKLPSWLAITLLILVLVVLALILVVIAVTATALASLFAFIVYRIGRGLDQSNGASLVSPPPGSSQNVIGPQSPFQVRPIIVVRGILLGFATVLLLLGGLSLLSPIFVPGGGIAALSPIMKVQQEEESSATIVNFIFSEVFGVAFLFGSLIVFGFGSGAFARSPSPPIQLNSRP